MGTKSRGHSNIETSSFDEQEIALDNNNNEELALTGVAQWIDHQPVN